MSHTRFIGLLVFGLSMPVPILAQASASAIRSEVQAAVRAYVEAHNRADAGAIAAIYSTEPGVTSIGDGEIVRGWDRIREHLDVLDRPSAAQGHLTLSVGSVDVTPLGAGYALAIASYTLTVGAQGTEARQRGAMTLVLRKVGGEWKIIHDHTSSVQQQAAAGPAVSPPTGQPVSRAAALGAPGAGTTISIATGAPSEIPAAGSMQYTFQITAAVCTITGRVEGVAGGNKDFELLILDDDNYRNWSAGLQAKAYGASGRVTVTTINAPVPGPGTYHLVISNAFAAATPKTVQVWAQAQCQ